MLFGQNPLREVPGSPKGKREIDLHFFYLSRLGVVNLISGEVSTRMALIS